ncbi:hypothetical protein [Streptomyces sp. NPDC087525]|uniref:hypothetical protein n=1 Tax=Streptomyces sp. NPDC087525 TaxID=3365793 RepID=UPI00381D47CF
MNTVRRPLGTGPRPVPSEPTQADLGGPRRVRAADADADADADVEADVDVDVGTAPLSRPGELEGLALFRERGVLGPA